MSRAAAQSAMDCLQHYDSLPARPETPEQAAALTQPTQVQTACSTTTASRPDRRYRSRQQPSPNPPKYRLSAALRQPPGQTGDSRAGGSSHTAHPGIDYLQHYDTLAVRPEKAEQAAALTQPTQVQTACSTMTPSQLGRRHQSRRQPSPNLPRYRLSAAL